MFEIRPPMDLIDGELCPAEHEMGVWLENPNTGEKLQQQMASSESTVERALAAAWRVHSEGIWENLPIEERAAYLAAFSTELNKRKDEIAYLESLTTGAIINVTSMLNIITTGAWHLAIEQMKSGWNYSTMQGPNNNTVEIHRKAWGPALALVPWNAPAPMAAHKIANALAAGAPCIIKPTEWSHNGTDIFGEAAQAAGIPAGVFQIVHGGADVGKKLVADSRIKAISFTGGLAGGRSIAAACAYDFKPAQLELGGNNAVVILEDANIEEAAQGVVNLLITLNGQWCRALGHLIVHESIEKTLLEAVFAELVKVKIGSSLSPESQMGPMVHSGHLAKISAQRDALIAKGGKAHSVSPLPDLAGNFIAPTLISGVSMADSQDEIFGPIGTIHSFKSDAEALALANGTPYGLEAYVFGADEERALALGRKIHAGGVKINGSSMISLNLFAPRPAWGWSGFSEEGTAETYRFFCGTRVVGVEGVLNFA
jgi:acyl-CoA reductase-like NAD-dependent aldehyde dehydrogenase